MALSSNTKKLRGSSIESLCDDLLLKILCRLPRISSYNCKYVCKRWLALTCTSFFDVESIRYHLKCYAPFALMKGCLYVWSDYGAVLSLSFLPCFKEQGKAVEILGFNQELWLCTVGGESNYYLCNPITKEWVSIPCAPELEVDDSVQFGFLFDSFSRYTVLRFPVDATSCEYHPALHLDMFSSETGEWTQVIVMCPKEGYSVAGYGRPTRAAVSNIVAHNQRLFWWSGCRTHLIVYDPYNKKCWFLEKPFDMVMEYNSFYTCFGVCRGCLRLCQPVGEGESRRPLSYPKRLMVWKLKEYGECRWDLQHNIDFKEISFNKKPMFFMPIGFNPNDEDILYMICHPDNIVSCDLRLKTIVDISEPDVLRNIVTMFFYPPFVSDAYLS